MFSIPDDYHVEAIIAVGQQGDASHLSEALQAREQPTPRRPVRDFVADGTFDFLDVYSVHVKSVFLPKKDFKGGGYSVSVFNARDAGGGASQGLGYSARGFISPINADRKLLHLGVTGTVERNTVLDTPTATLPTANDWRVRPRLIGANYYFIPVRI